MATIHETGIYQVSRKEFNDFAHQYLTRDVHTPLDLILKLRKHWLAQLECGAKKTIALPAAPSMFNGLFADAQAQLGTYALFVKHPQHSPQQWVCFYVGISEINTRQRVVQHHCSDTKEDYRGVFHFLSECTDVASCYAKMERLSTNTGEQKSAKTKEMLIMLEHCLTSEFRPWFLALAAGVQPASRGNAQPSP
jgi:hypothetical protein